jgi:hypothetical protein
VTRERRSGGRPAGQLGRALVDLTIGMRNGERDRADALRSTRSGEYDQQVQERFSGEAQDAWGFADIPVTWEHPFVYSPLQRDPQFLTPHVTDHIEFTSTQAGLVLAKAHVIGWRKSPQGWFIGATVRLATCAPGAVGMVAYAGILHLIFQGYAYPTDGELST